MPTAARLFGFLAFAALGFIASGVFIPLLPEGTQTTLLGPINAVIGGLCGWLVCGPNVGRGYYAAAGIGVRTALTLLFFALIGWATYEMIIDSMRPGAFGGPMEAINGAFALLFEYLTTIALDYRITLPVGEAEWPVPQVLIALIVGGIFGGWFAEWAAERFS
ncbi:TrgA family protein [Alphaproteobacteria bacterium KMM 3653]|uniref:TrgA family protein n=1 Tax=Harenicola maris TaxID=2841044 RepID=A0AAP2CLR2_9RHOB|nr:TrgA family protein [Harenicola maris]